MKSLPPNLDQAFGSTIERIEKQHDGLKDQALRILQWIHLAKDALTVDELMHALATDGNQEELDYENFPSRSTFLECCLGLVIIDIETSSVRFVHYSLQEYMNSQTQFLQLRDQPGHESIAKTCLTYLSFETNRENSVTQTTTNNVLPEIQDEYWNDIEYDSDGYNDVDGKPKNKAGSPWQSRLPFLGYAARHWGRHALKSKDFDNNTTVLILRYLSMSPEERRTSTALLYNHATYARADRLQYESSLLFSGLHMVAYFGLCRVFNQVLSLDLEKYLGADSTDDYGRTPLSWAAENGHEAVVKLLVEREDVKADSTDTTYGQTPLSRAAENGHEAVVKLLVEREDVKADSTDTTYGQTPLSRAAENGHEAVVKLLVEREDVKADSTDTTGRTPLSRAAANGHEAVVKLLVEREDVKADSTDGYGRTPLSWAAANGHEAVVKLLVERAGRQSRLDCYYQPNTAVVGGCKRARGCSQAARRAGGRQSRLD